MKFLVHKILILLYNGIYTLLGDGINKLNLLCNKQGILEENLFYKA